MKSGTMRNVLNFQTNTATQNALGEPGPKVWTDTRSGVWCRIHPVTAKDLMAADQEHASCSHIIGTRYDAAIVAFMRGVDQNDGKIYEVVAVYNVDNLYKELKIFARTGVSNG